LGEDDLGYIVCLVLAIRIAGAANCFHQPRKIGIEIPGYYLQAGMVSVTCPE
jgi:hypothetical protein